MICGILHAQYSQYAQVGAFGDASACSSQIDSLVEKMRPGRARAYWQALGLTDRSSSAYARGDYATGYRLGQGVPALIESDEFDCFLYGKERGRAFWGSGAYGYLASTAFALGDYDACERNFAISDAIREASGEERFRAMDLGHHALRAQTVGDLARARGACP